ncbi:MAG: T9SS type A sorting domain-containing protein [bacterium]
MKNKIIIISIMSLIQLALLNSQEFEMSLAKSSFILTKHNAYPFAGNSVKGSSTYKDGFSTLDLMLDTITDYYERSTGFDMYFYRDQNQVVRPITGTNNVYHLIGVKYEIKAAGLLGVLVAFGTKITTGDADSLDLLITSADDETGLPKSPILANTGFSVNDIDTNSKVPVFTPIMLKESTPIDGKFTIMIKVWTQTNESDLVVVFSNLQGDGKKENTAFLGIVQEQGITSVNFDEFPVTMGDGNPPDFDLMILPIIEKEAVNSEEYFSINNIKVSCIYPNPAVGKVKLKLFFNDESDVILDIFDVKGRMVQNLSYYNLSAGENILDMDLSKLNNGNYFYIIKTTNTSFAGKIVIER